MPQRENRSVPRGRRRAIGAATCAALALAASSCARPAAPQRPADPQIALGPWVLSPGSTQATVAWTTATKVAGAVSFSAADASASARPAATVREPEARTEHRVVLSNLAPLTAYRYRVEGPVPAEGAFSTAPDAFATTDRPFRVLIYGDNRSNNGDHELLVRAASAEPVQLALHTGDMVVNAKDQQAWAAWFEAERDLLSRTAFVPTVGNHEITDKGVTYSEHFLEKGLPTYRAFEYGPVHLMVLDSFEVAAGAEPHEGAISDTQRAWAEADVKALAPDRHLWVLVHQGPYSHPQHPRAGHGGSEAVRNLVASLQRLHPVEAIWAGHEHFYERGVIEGMHYFVVGGGGAPLEDPDGTFPSVQAARKALSYVVVDVCGCHAAGKAKDLFGNVIDAFTLSDCPQPCAGFAADDAAARPAVRAAAASSAAPSTPAADASAGAPAAPAAAAEGPK